MSSSPLTRGSVVQMAAMTVPKDASMCPTVQLINVRPVKAPDSTTRYRIVLSDGEHFINGMLTTQLNPLVEDGSLVDNVVVRIDEFMNNRVADKTVIVVLRLSVQQQMPERIGAPVDVAKAPPAAHSEHYSNAAATNPYGASPPAAAGRPSSTSSAPIYRTEGQSSTSHITPIAGLNLYSNRWTIKARLTSKSDIRTWRNAKGEGSLFSMELLDHSGTDIRATCFKEAVDKFYPMLQVGKVYTFTGGRLKVADLKWNTCKSNFEITFDQNSEIHLEDDSGDIQAMNYDFTYKIAQLEDLENNKFVDLIAICKSVGEPVHLISKKSGQELTKCDVILVDDSEAEICLTFWGEKAQKAPSDYADNAVLAIRRARVSDYSGKSLSAGDAIQVNPDIPEAQRLRDWWTRTGGNVATRSLTAASGGAGGKVDGFSERKAIASIKEDGLGFKGDKADWITIKGTLTFLKKDKEGGAWYPACPNAGEPCKNRYKVSQTTDGQWFCDKCQGSFPDCLRRWIFSAVVQDDTASTWISFFNEQAEELLGATADEVYQKSYGQGFDQDAYDSYFAKAIYSEWVIRCKIKNETLNDESRVKASAVSMVPVDYVKDSLDMLAAIEKF